MVHIENILSFYYQSLYRNKVNSFLVNNNRLHNLNFVEDIYGYFNISYKVNQQQIENVPVTGKAIVITNHSLETTDALSLIKMLSDIRQDDKNIKIVANKMFSFVPQLSSLLIPIDNITGKPTKTSLQAIEEALENEELVVFFPSGEDSSVSQNTIQDDYWKSNFRKIAQKTNTTVVPIHLSTRNSYVFNNLSYVYKHLSSFLH